MTLASNLKGHIRGFIIANEVGNYLVEVVADKTINSSLISAFVSGLSQLGKQNLGVLYDIAIHAESLNLIVVLKYKLSLIAIFDPKVEMKDAQEEAVETLDDFFIRYKRILEEWDGDQEVFEPYVKALKERLSTYIKRTHESKENLFSKLSSTTS